MASLSLHPNLLQRRKKEEEEEGAGKEEKELPLWCWLCCWPLIGLREVGAGVRTSCVCDT